MVGRYRSIDRDYQGQLSRRLRSRVLMHAYATRGLGFLVRCAIISRQLGQGRQRSGGSPLFMINHRSSNNWGERSEAPHGRYIWDFPYIIIIIYRRTSDCSNFALRRTARTLTAHAHRCVKLKQGQSILNKVRKGMQAKSKLTRLLGYYWLSDKLIGSLHIHALHTCLLLHLLLQ